MIVINQLHLGLGQRVPEQVSVRISVTAPRPRSAIVVAEAGVSWRDLRHLGEQLGVGVPLIVGARDKVAGAENQVWFPREAGTNGVSEVIQRHGIRMKVAEVQHGDLPPILQTNRDSTLGSL